MFLTELLTFFTAACLFAIPLFSCRISLSTFLIDCLLLLSRDCSAGCNFSSPPQLYIELLLSKVHLRAIWSILIWQLWQTDHFPRCDLALSICPVMFVSPMSSFCFISFFSANFCCVLEMYLSSAVWACNITKASLDRFTNFCNNFTKRSFYCKLATVKFF